MSQGPIIHALRRGPMRTAQLLRLTGTCSGDISRSCANLIRIGAIKRIDGGSGRGSIAVYALADCTAPVPAATRAKRFYHHVAPQPEVTESQFVQRDPCFSCGVRGDLGCKHRGVHL
jgi:hypothetical protein